MTLIYAVPPVGAIFGGLTGNWPVAITGLSGWFLMAWAYLPTPGFTDVLLVGFLLASDRPPLYSDDSRFCPAALARRRRLKGFILNLEFKYLGISIG